MSFAVPDRYFSRLSRIDIQRDLIDCGFTHVLLDIDNTVRVRGRVVMPRDVGVWLGKARDAGIVFCFVSNNWHRDVYELAHSVNLPLVAKACKPLPFGFIVAMNRMKSNRLNTVVIGDQLATDVVGAHMLGMKAYMLMPLVEHDLPHTALLRNVERMVLRDRQPDGVAHGCKSSIQECTQDSQGGKQV